MSRNIYILCHGCGKRFQRPLEKCKRCQEGRFCSRSCFVRVWPEHKKVCVKRDKQPSYRSVVERLYKNHEKRLMIDYLISAIDPLGCMYLQIDVTQDPPKIVRRVRMSARWTERIFRTCNLPGLTPLPWNSCRFYFHCTRGTQTFWEIDTPALYKVMLTRIAEESTACQKCSVRIDADKLRQARTVAEWLICDECRDVQ